MMEGDVVSVFLISVVFVGSLYLWAFVDGKKYLTANRNHPAIIKKRAISATLATIVLLCVFSWTIGVSPIISALGLSLPSRHPCPTTLLLHVLLSVASGVVLTLALFLGPLVMEIADTVSEASDRVPSQSPNHHKELVSIIAKNVSDFLSTCLFDPLFLRAQIVAPIAEEICYRLLPILLLSSTWSCSQLIWITPLFFGMAHLHHVFSLILLEGVPWHSAILSSRLCLPFLSFPCLFSL